MKNIKLKSILAAAFIAVCLFSSFVIYQKSKPTLYLIGDSTVKNGRDDGQHKGADGLWGWGHYLGEYFNEDKIVVENDALGGTSSRTFYNNQWPAVLNKIKPGDYLMMQFGHNDSSPVNDTSRARGTIRSNGEETQEIDNMITKKHEVVHSYGWYLRKFVSEAKAKGAVGFVICSPIPRNSWSADGKIHRNSTDYGKWAKEAAMQAGVSFLDLNQIISDHYDEQGEAKVKAVYFHTDATHTIEAGAKFNATAVVKGIKELKDCNLKKFLK
jgi:rhamnogalacturonan acetylesterase